MSFLVRQEEERKKIRVKLMASLSPVGLVWVGAVLGFRLRLTKIKPQTMTKSGKAKHSLLNEMRMTT